MTSFLDSNIVLYLLEDDNDKQLKAEQLLLEMPIINPQVLVEVGNVCRRKFGYSKK